MRRYKGKENPIDLALCMNRAQFKKMFEPWRLQILLIVVALSSVGVQSVPPQLLPVGERVFHDELKDEDRKFVSDPSANTDGICMFRSHQL